MIFRFRQMSCCQILLVIGILLIVVPAGQCQTIYVDDLQGSDSLDGSSAEAVNEFSGPFQTIGRALKAVKQGGAIIVANNGNPYHESLQMTGQNGSGFSNRPIRIIGNGAVVDGSRPVPANAWKRIKLDLWAFRPKSKGHYQLLLNREVVPELTIPSSVFQLPKIPVHQWAAWKGGIYYRSKIEEVIPEQEFRFAYHTVGLSLYNVHDVSIENLTFQHFQLDGINAHSLCKRIRFNKVQSHGNGRSGLFVGGTSDVAIANSDLRNNRTISLLIRGLAGAKLQKTEIDGEPRFIR